ncbi:MAG: beta-galactosidase [Desulfurococcaceae archaeon]
MSGFLLCGEVHYFRVPRSLWYDRLLKLKRAGANCVSTYIPWNWHMPRRGVVDFEDSYRDPLVPGYFSRRLRNYFELAEKLGLKIVARPGPYICSEWDSGGHPNWLYAEKCRLRSLDPCYLSYTLEWYRAVMPIVAEFAERGVVPVVQVENEYFWGNEPFIEKLQEEAAKHLRNTLIVTNENYYLSRVPNTIDDYPSPWSIRGFEEKVEKYVRSQPGLFKMFMELQGGWFSSIKHGAIPTDRLSIPAEWTELLVKTAFMMGVDNINVYMFHGGTNPGYYTAKYITTSYDYEAPVREWGYLSQRYFNVKRVYTFLSTFGEILGKTKPTRNTVKASLGCSEVYARSGENATLVLLRNTSDTVCYERLIRGDSVLPHSRSIRVPPRYGKLILLEAEIPGSPFKLIYSTLEPLLYLKFGSTWVMIFYGDREEAELEITTSKAVQRMLVIGDVNVSSVNGVIRAEATVDVDDRVVALETVDHERLIVVLTSRKRAERTWILDVNGKPLVLVSNIYYVGNVEDRGIGFSLEVELDSESCGRVLAVTPLKLEEIYVNGLKLEVSRLHEDVYEFTLSPELCVLDNPREVVLSSFTAGWDPVDHGYVRIEPYTPLETAGFYDNGFYVYRIKFNVNTEVLSRLRDRTLAVVGVFDYAVVKLNDVFLASGYHMLEANASVALREGLNELRVIVEATGHPNDGLIYVPNGIATGVYLSRVEVRPLTGWRKIELKPDYGAAFDMAEFMENPAKVLSALKNWRSMPSLEVADIGSQGLYVKEIHVENPGLYYVFDPGSSFYTNHYYRALLFVNGFYVGPITGPIDISKYLKPGVNEVAVYVEYGFLTPVLRVYEQRIEGEWLVQKSTRGLIEEWFKPEHMLHSDLRTPVRILGRGGDMVWLKASFKLNEQPDPSRPLKLIVDSNGMRVLVFVNEFLVGRVYDDSPSRELYVPEAALKPGENTVTLMCLLCSNTASLNAVKLSEYHVHRRTRIECTVKH